MISYAQHGEDTTLDRLTGHRDKGVYVDVGAYDPHSLSVTKLFYLRGWRGVNIDPKPGTLEKFERDRPGDVNICAAIGETVGDMQLYCAPGAGSTLVPEHGRRWADDGGAVATVPVVRIETVFEEHLPGRTVDFLKVDVEGYEAQVLRSNDWSRFRPRVLCVEAVLPYSRKDASAAFEPYLIDNGYELVERDQINKYYKDIT